MVDVEKRLKLPDGAVVFDIIKDYCEKLEQKTEFTEIEKPQQPSEHSPVKPFYQQTVDFMKKSGYTHCYMCGSQLE